MRREPEFLPDEITISGGEEAQAQKILDAKIPVFDADGKKKSQITLLIEIAAQWTLFHDGDLNAYAAIPRNNHTETWPIRSSGFRRALGNEFFKTTGRGCNGNSLCDALNTIEARAISGKNERVFLRVARADNAIYIDLADNAWRVIEITGDGWRVLEQSPVYFVRKNGMAQLAIPAKNGDVSKLKSFVNVNDSQFKLIVAWTLGALRGCAPFPILALSGQHGSGKSTLSTVLRALIDPSTVPLRPPPREERDLLISAANNHLVVLDNLSGMKPGISDCLCRLATGGGLDGRKLYTDMEQILVDVQRPVMVNGIDDLATRPDFIDRAIILNLNDIEPGERRDERGFWLQFNAAKPSIFGGLLDAVSGALKHENAVVMPKKPRMADFAIWVTAAEFALDWRPGAFLAVYTQMLDRAVIDAIESSSVGNVLLSAMEYRDEWHVSPSDLLRDLTERAGNSAKSHAWPKTTKGLSNILNRLAPSFRAVGILIERGRPMAARHYKITNGPLHPSYPSHPSQPTAGGGSSMTDSKSYPSLNTRYPSCMTDRDRLMTDSKSDPSSPKPSNDAGSSGFLGDRDGYDGYKHPICNNDDECGIDDDGVDV